jgi:hypothetical protein
MSDYTVGDGILAAMQAAGDEPASDEVYGASFALATSGKVYAWSQAGGVKVYAPGDAPTPAPSTLEAHLRALLGGQFRDERANLPDAVSPKYGAFEPRGLSLIEWIAIHHTAGPETQTPRQIYDFHIGASREWGGIGYHLLVDRNGEVYYVGDIHLSRANVAGLNHKVVGICFIGRFDAPGARPTDAALASARKAIAAIRSFLSRDVRLARHGDLNPTACPGGWDLGLLG